LNHSTINSQRYLKKLISNKINFANSIELFFLYSIFAFDTFFIIFNNTGGMPYRRLPNTDSARLRAMKRALERGKEIPPFKMAFSQKNLVKLQGFLPRFENSISLYRQTTGSQAEKSSAYQENSKKARLYLSHFLRVMNLAVQRGELPPETRTYYSIPAEDSTLPSLATDNELITWGKRVIDGEEYRKKRGCTPITNPSIAVVTVWYEQFVEAHRFHKTLHRRSSEYAAEIAELRNEADQIILNIWNQVESFFSGLPDSEKRSEAENYGLVYVFRKNELKQ
jgi:hypothetical protein